jgi:hypothetical protein
VQLGKNGMNSSMDPRGVDSLLRNIELGSAFSQIEDNSEGKNGCFMTLHRAKA